MEPTKRVEKEKNLKRFLTSFLTRFQASRRARETPARSLSAPYSIFVILSHYLYRTALPLTISHYFTISLSRSRTPFHDLKFFGLLQLLQEINPLVLTRSDWFYWEAINQKKEKGLYLEYDLLKNFRVSQFSSHTFNSQLIQ